MSAYDTQQPSSTTATSNDPTYEIESTFPALDIDDIHDWEDYYPEEALEEYAANQDKTDITDITDPARDFSSVTNDEFLSAIFGTTFDEAKPLVCKKSGDPDVTGWHALTWPSNTSNADLNWYCLPGTYKPDPTGRYRAKKELAISLYAIMLDDIGTKVPIDLVAPCKPSWMIETSPGNFQVGYIFVEPITNHQIAEDLKDALISAGLCDAGANGATARWMRLPVAINGRPKYGAPSPKCKLTLWKPERRYTVDEIASKLNLSLVSPAATVARTPDPQGEADLTNDVVVELVNRGLYKKPIANGKHDITCPWVDQHTDAIDNGTAYFEPNSQYPTGGFKCHHSHGASLYIRDLLNFLGMVPPVTSSKPVILTKGGQINQICLTAERELASTGHHFQRGSLIVSIDTNPETGNTTIVPLTQPALLRALSEVAEWTRLNERQHVVIIDPPAKYVRGVLEAQKYPHLPSLKGLARQPYLASDNSIIYQAGYSQLTGMFGVFNPQEFPIPDSPTMEDALVALGHMKALLGEFGFVDLCDEAAAIAAMLTAAIRIGLPTAPMFHVKAHQVASGKSYLCSIIAAFASNVSPAALAFPPNEEECQKLLIASLLESTGLLFFDNINSDIIPYKSLCSMLTEEYLVGRILGVSKTATVGTRTLVLSSGNNVGPIRDICRRCISIHLDPRVEIPAARQFKGSPLDLVRARRGQFVAYAFTVVRAYLLAGKPKVSATPIASYGHWNLFVRQPLLWLGLPDPTTRMMEQISIDPDRELLGRFIEAWINVYKDRPTMVREAVNDVGLLYRGLIDHDQIELREVFSDIALEKGEINRRRLGWWISRHQGQVVNGRRLERCKSSGNAEKWSVKSV